MICQVKINIKTRKRLSHVKNNLLSIDSNAHPYIFSNSPPA